MVAKTVKSKSKTASVMKPRLTLTENYQKVIVFLRFGSLEQIGQPVMKISSIAQTLKRPWTTVYRVLQRFEANGHKIVNRKRQCGRKKSAVPDRVLNYLKCEQTLEELAWLSLQQRCAILEKRFRFKCTRKKLRSIYSDLNISYLRPKLVDFRAKRDAAELAAKRREFATQLNELMKAD